MKVTINLPSQIDLAQICEFAQSNSLHIIVIVVLVILLFNRVLHLARIAKENKRLSTVTQRERGTWSEQRVVIKMLRMNFGADSIFHDLYIQNSYGEYTQIDLVVMTNDGLLVFEVKDYSGWIFGSGLDKNWTQILAYGERKYRFYNPVKQNEGHVKALQYLLQGCGKISFHSIIAFYGDCKLKKISNIPDNTTICYASQVKRVVKSLVGNTNNFEICSYDRQKVAAKLREGVQNGANPEVVRSHRRRVNDISGK